MEMEYLINLSQTLTKISGNLAGRISAERYKDEKTSAPTGYKSNKNVQTFTDEYGREWKMFAEIDEEE